MLIDWKKTLFRGAEVPFTKKQDEAPEWPMDKTEA